MEEVAQISGAHVLVAEIGGKANLRSPRSRTALSGPPAGQVSGSRSITVNGYRLDAMPATP